MKRGNRVCCDLDAAIKVGLLPKSLPDVAIAPLLPGGQVDSESACLQKGGRHGHAFSIDGVSHVLYGFRLFFLASDFLCRECQLRFHTLRIDDAPADVLAEWCARMQCHSFEGNARCMRDHLVAEQARFVARTHLVALARSAVHGIGEQRIAFRTFCDSFLPERFESRLVETAIIARQKLAPVSEFMQVSPGRYAAHGRCFGLMADPSKSGWWSAAVPLVSEPCDWMDYAGRPSYCAVDLWYLRAWSRALGGFWHMSPELQRDLLALERREDSNFCFVELDGGCDHPASWIHVDKLHPGIPPY